MPDDLRRGRMLVGDVHDNYAAALGGVAGHAGLFGSATAVGSFARAVLRALRGDTMGPVPFTPALTRRKSTDSAMWPSSAAARERSRTCQPSPPERIAMRMEMI